MTWIIKPQYGGGSYQILSTELGFICQYQDQIYTYLKCKHSLQWVESSQIEGQITIPEINIKSCPRFKLNNIVIDPVLNAIKLSCRLFNRNKGI